MPGPKYNYWYTAIYWLEICQRTAVFQSGNGLCHCLGSLMYNCLTAWKGGDNLNIVMSHVRLIFINILSTDESANYSTWFAVATMMTSWNITSYHVLRFITCRGWFSMNVPSYQCRNSHCGDRAVLSWIYHIINRKKRPEFEQANVCSLWQIMPYIKGITMLSHVN